jgi:hypothetical protein
LFLNTLAILFSSVCTKRNPSFYFSFCTDKKKQKARLNSRRSAARFCLPRNELLFEPAFQGTQAGLFLLSA